MIIVAALVLVAVVVIVLGALGGGAVGDRAPRSGVLGAPTLSIGLLVLGGIVVVVIAAGAMTVVGLRGGGEGDGGGGDRVTVPSREEQAAPTDPPPRAGPATTDVAPGRAEQEGNAVPSSTAGSAALGPVVRISADDSDAEVDGFPVPPPVLDELQDRTVLRMRVRGFEPFARGRAEQCATSAEGTRCANSIEVQFAENGTASFQYFVTADAAGAAPEECGPEGPTCVLVVRDAAGPARVDRRTVFGGEAPAPGRVSVTPRTGIVAGETVRVSVAGFPPGTRARAVLCVAPGTGGPDRCGSPGPVAELVVGAGGTGTTQLRVEVGPVGRERARCGRGDPCGVAVVADHGASARVVPLSFAAPAGAGYDGTRLGAGLGVAAALLIALAWLVLRTDWSPVGEAAAPEIDHATYADLDAEVAAMPPEDDEDQLLASGP